MKTSLKSIKLFRISVIIQMKPFFWIVEFVDIREMNKTRFFNLHFKSL